MPRESKTQTTIRSGGGQSEITAPTERVISGRLFIQNPHMNVVSDKAKGQLRMADAAKGLQKSVLSVMDQRAKANEKRDFMDGQEAALTGDTTDVDYFTKTTEGQTKSFIQGMAAATARKNGHKMVADIKGELANGNHASEADARGVIQSHLESNLEGMDDETYRGVMLNTVEEQEEALLTTWREEKSARVLDAVTTDYNAAQRNDFRDAAANGATVPEMHTIYRTYMDQADMTGITRQAAGEMALQNIEESAIANGRMDLFDIFEIANQAAEDPSLTLPGLANSPKFQKKIMDAKRRVAKTIKKDTTARTNKAEYGMLKNHQDLVHGESYREAYDNVENLFNAGVYTDKQAIAERERIYNKMQVEDKVIHGAGLAGEGQIGIKGTEQGYSKAEKQMSVDSFSRDQYQAATAENMHQVHGVVIGRAVQNGIAPSFHVATLNDVTPHNMEAWAGAVELYKRYEAVSPAFLAQQGVTEEQMMNFHSYEALLSRGYDPESARAAVATMPDPEYVQSVLRDKKPEWDAKINKEIVNNVDLKWTTKEGSVENGQYVRDRIKEGARLYIAMHSSSNTAEALEYSTKQFHSNHTMMTTPAGKFIYTYHGGQPLPDDFNETVQWYSDEMVTRKGADEVNASSLYTISPNPYDITSDMWQVRKADGSPVVVENKEYGYSTPLMVNRDVLIAAYAAEQVRKSKPPVKSRRQLTYEMKNLQLERQRKEQERKDSGLDSLPLPGDV